MSRLERQPVQADVRRPDVVRDIPTMSTRLLQTQWAGIARSASHAISPRRGHPRSARVLRAASHATCRSPKPWMGVTARSRITASIDLPKRTTSGTSKPWRLKPFSPADAGDRELALAYMQLYQQTRDERQKNEAIRLSTR